MKKYSLLAAVAMLTVGSFTSCSKDDDPNPVTKTELLTAHNWHITAYTTTVDNGPVEDTYKDFPECRRDDIYQFKTDKTFVYDHGKERCNAADPQTTVNGWDISADGTTLLMLDMPGINNAALYEIKELTKDKLRIGRTQMLAGRSLTTEVTYTKL